LILGVALAGVAFAADEPPKPETTVDGSQGFVTVKSGDNALTFGAWGQFRITDDDREKYDADTVGSGVGKEDGNSVSFAVWKIRPYIQGTVYKPWLKFKFEVEIGPLSTNATSNISNARITDGYAEFAKYSAATLRVGQFKVPFGLEELTPDTKQEFVDRSITNAKFAPSRDIGLMLYGAAWDRKFGYQVALFNGAGQDNPQDDQGQMYAARVWIDPLGEYILSETANNDVHKNIFHFGVAYRGGEVDKGTATPGVFQSPDNETAASVEIAWRWSRLYAMGEYFVQKDELKNPVVAPDVNARGYHAQFGVMVHPTKHEIAVRYAQVEANKDVTDATQTEARIVYGYYIKGHNLKIQSDAGEISYGKNFSTLSALALRNVSPTLDPTKRLTTLPGKDITDKQVRVQLTVAF
jgi:hypothetical protein